MCWEVFVILGCGCRFKRCLSDITRTSMDSLIRFSDETLVEPCNIARDIGKLCPKADRQPHQEYSINLSAQCISCLARRCQPSFMPPKESKMKNMMPRKPRDEKAKKAPDSMADSDDETDDGCSKHDKMMAVVHRLLGRKEQLISEQNFHPNSQ